jgi:hypothetical protein
MGYLTAEQIDLATDYDWLSFWTTPVKGSTYDTEIGIVVLREYSGRCDHETCYETHGTRLVFSLGDRYFLKEGTYNSQDGFQWTGPLREVRPVKKTVQDFESVPVKVWDLAGINEFLRYYIEEQPGTKWSGYDWTTLYYQARDGLEIPGFPFEIRAVEEYTPGEPESNGPVWLIFEINGVRYAAKGRNISHVGWDFDSVYGLEVVEKKTVTMDIWE